ncbi:MAG TPA: hypothetical protein VMZ53_05820 [Kofleriaceae bacterium]|nr:hypothetical protein [Kofleriaceae bacterium]
MRYSLLIAMVLAACGDDGGSSTPHPDAAQMVDARMIDAAIDAPPDAPPADNAAITMTCTDLCDAIGVCFMEPPDASCVTDCSADLADCTAQQVTDLDACKTEACGDETASPIFDCITAVSCVDG